MFQNKRANKDRHENKGFPAPAQQTSHSAYDSVKTVKSTLSKLPLDPPDA